MQFPSTCLIDFYLFQFLTNSDNGDGRVEEKIKTFYFGTRLLCYVDLFFFVLFFVAGIMVREENL